MRKSRLFIILLCFVLFASGCNEAAEEEIPELLEPVGKSITEAQVQRKTLYSTKVYNGEVIPEIVEYSFPEKGSLSALSVEVGGRVNKGEIICKVDNTSVNAEIQSLQNQINELQSTVGYQIKTLEEENAKEGITWQQREMNELLIRQCHEVMDDQLAALVEKQENAKNRLACSEITADFSGDVIAVSGTVGRTVYAGTPIVAVAKPDTAVVVTSYIDQETLDAAYRIYTLADGNPVNLRHIKDEPADEPVYSYFEPVDCGQIYVGDYAPIIMISDYRENVLTVTKDAIYTENKTDYVYVTTDGNRTKTIVTLGFEGLNDYEVLDGLSENDRVFVKDDSTTATRSLQTIRGDFVLTTKSKASTKYTETATLSATKTYGSLVFKQFEVDTFTEVKKGDVLASYYETVDENYIAETEFALEYALREKNAEEIGRLENLLEDLYEACTNRVVTAPFDGMINSTERLYKGGSIASSGKIGTFASTKNMLLTVDNTGNAYRYGQTVLVEATIDGKTVTGTGHVLSASSMGLSSNFNTSTAIIRLDEGCEALYRGANRFVTSNNIVIENVVLVDVKSVFNYNGDLTVLVGNGNGNVRMRFENGRRGNDYYWAVDGLTEGLTLYFN